MGWDAYSEPFKTGGYGLDPNAGDRAWDEVVESFRLRNIPMDGLLQHGGLDVSTSGEMLQRATGLSVYGPSWSKEEVRVLAKTAMWDFEVSKEQLWAKESARAFLEHCAKLGRGIRFSW